jgi:hypothetical protein
MGHARQWKSHWSGRQEGRYGNGAKRIGVQSGADEVVRAPDCKDMPRTSIIKKEKHFEQAKRVNDTYLVVTVD